jgi:hypothetical protein
MELSPVLTFVGYKSGSISGPTMDWDSGPKFPTNRTILAKTQKMFLSE